MSTKLNFLQDIKTLFMKPPPSEIQEKFKKKKKKKGLKVSNYFLLV